MKKILVLGDYTDVPYHPLGGVDDAIQDILGTGTDYAITCTEDYTTLADLNEYDLFISYTDCWKRENCITDAMAAGLITYVANGGKFIVLHCGLSLQQRAELIPLMGGKFVHHPKMADIAVSVVAENDPITAGVAPFVTLEEPYQCAFDPFAPPVILTEYQYDGKVYPHSWKKTYCKGEVVFLMGGHTADIVREDGNALLLKNTVEYLLR